jgi:hypothetical protein
MSKREAFNFYRSYYDTLNEIYTDGDKLKYLMALLDKQFRGIEPELTGISKLAYNSQKHSIDKQVEGWETKTKQKLYDPTEDTTEGGYVGVYVGGSQGGLIGGMGHPNLHPTEPPTQYPSNNSVMTTEGGIEPPTQDPYQQEQEQEKEKEHIATNILGEKEMKQFYINNKVEVEYIRSQYGYSLEEAIQVHYNNIRELDKLWVN